MTSLGNSDISRRC